MCMRNCGCLVSMAIAVILGILLGVIAFTTLIPGIFVVLLIAFLIGFVSMTGVAVMAAGRRVEKCICRHGTCLAIASFGLVVTSIIALAISIVPGIGVAVLLGIVTFFLVLAILELLQLVLCMVRIYCRCSE